MQFKKLFVVVSLFLKHLTETIFTTMLIIITSKKTNTIPSTTNKKCVILGNGPSLRECYDNWGDLLDAKDIYVTNDFSRTELFTIVKPACYIIADPAFFTQHNPSEVQARVDEVWLEINKATWRMIVFVPVKYNRKAKIYLTNDILEIIPYNSTRIEGFRAFRYIAYNAQLGMPRVQNVLIAALMLSMARNYSNINLWGVDHNWMHHMVLDENNILCLSNHHFFNKSKRITPWHRHTGGVFKVHEALYALYLMFRSYSEIAHYAETKNIFIENNSEKSMIDAFPKKPMSK
jgi:hypothetical protein